MNVGLVLVSYHVGIGGVHVGSVEGGAEDGRVGLLRPNLGGGNTEVQYPLQLQLLGKGVHVSAQVGNYPKYEPLLLELLQGWQHVFEKLEVLLDEHGHLPHLVGQLQIDVDTGRQQDAPLVLSEERSTGFRAAQSQWLFGVGLVKILVGDHITSADVGLPEGQAQLATGRLLDLIQGRPESHQGIVEVEEYSLFHL